jgi:tripartite-type tricarboxylate transporter receptor subunit TctC
VAKLNQALNAVVGDPEVKRRLAEVGVSTTGGSPAELTALIASETERWRKVVTALGVKPGAGEADAGR